MEENGIGKHCIVEYRQADSLWMVARVENRVVEDENITYTLKTKDDNLKTVPRSDVRLLIGTVDVRTGIRWREGTVNIG